MKLAGLPRHFIFFSLVQQSELMIAAISTPRKLAEEKGPGVVFDAIRLRRRPLSFSRFSTDLQRFRRDVFLFKLFPPQHSYRLIDRHCNRLFIKKKVQECCQRKMRIYQNFNLIQNSSFQNTTKMRICYSKHHFPKLHL